MKSTKLIFFSSSQLAAISRHVESLLSVWSENWLQGQKAAQITQTFQYSPDRDKQLGFSKSIVVSNSETVWGAYLNSGESYNNLMSILLGSSNVNETKVPKTSLANGLLEQALQELFSTISACSGSAVEIRATSSLPIDCTRLGAGSVVLNIQICNVNLHLLLSPHVVRNIDIPKFNDTCDVKRSTLTPVISALVDQKVRCRVNLGFAELKLSELLTLQLGDVITLDQALESPAKMTINGVEAFQVFLGKEHQQVAVRIISEAN